MTKIFDPVTNSVLTAIDLIDIARKARELMESGPAALVCHPETARRDIDQPIGIAVFTSFNCPRLAAFTCPTIESAQRLVELLDPNGERALPDWSAIVELMKSWRQHVPVRTPENT